MLLHAWVAALTVFADGVASGAARPVPPAHRRQDFGMPAPDPERETVRRAEQEALKCLLDRLPEKERLVLRERLGRAQAAQRVADAG